MGLPLSAVGCQPLNVNYNRNITPVVALSRRNRERQGFSVYPNLIADKQETAGALGGLRATAREFREGGGIFRRACILRRPRSPAPPPLADPLTASGRALVVQPHSRVHCAIHRFDPALGQGTGARSCPSRAAGPAGGKEPPAVGACCRPGQPGRGHQRPRHAGRIAGDCTRNRDRPGHRIPQKGPGTAGRREHRSCPSGDRAERVSSTGGHSGS